MTFDPTWLFISMIPSGVGFVLLVYGKKRQRWPHMIAGLLFSVGMMIASTASSQLIYRVIGSARTEAATAGFRRAIGWFVVMLSFGVVAVAVTEKLGGF